MKWQPIDTAPRDGSVILVFDVDEAYASKPVGFTVMAVRWCPYSKDDFRAPGGQWFAHYGPCRARNPTYWMPLPDPPD
jgi:hypothetical protein